MDDALYAEIAGMIGKHSPVRVNIPSRRAASLISPIGLRIPVAYVPIRDLNNTICAYLVNTAGVLSIELLDGARIGTGVAGAIPSLEYFLFDRATQQIRGYCNTGNIVIIAPTGLYPGGDAAQLFGDPAFRWLDMLTSRSIGIHDGTRFRTALDSTLGVEVVDAVGGLLAQISPLGTADSCGVSYEDDSEFINLDESAAAAVGSKWRIRTVTAAAIIADARGGVRRYATANTTPCVLDGWNRPYVPMDYMKLFTRFAIQATANQRAFVGFVDAAPAPGAGSLPYTNEGAGICYDSAVGGNWLLRVIQGGAVTDVDTTVAVVAGEFARFRLRSNNASRIFYLRVNDAAAEVACAAGQSPLLNQNLTKCIYIDNIGGAVSAQLDIDCFKPSQKRSTDVTP